MQSVREASIEMDGERDHRDGAARARAGANVALVKYWGKRDAVRNLPAVSSLSMTLRELTADAVVRRHEIAPATRFVGSDGPVAGSAADRMSDFLDWLAVELAITGALSVEVDANFPIGAGLASSAAIYCAVTAAAASLAGDTVGSERLSGLARRGSGSAARSVHGGFVEWDRGVRADGADSVARPLLGEDAWDLAMAVAVIEEGPKSIPSRDAMEHVVATSDLFPAFVEAQPRDLAAAREAIGARDLVALGTIAEENCLRMHATCFAARPAVQFWAPGTIAAMSAVRGLRADGLGAWFTIDAGPQVKVLCARDDLAIVADAMARVDGVRRVLSATVGPGVQLLTDGQAPGGSAR